ncbi:MAG: hypothetical protein ACI9TY_001493 [Alphaproteobacteria bacterium]|jgi:hypothetical protein
MSEEYFKVQTKDTKIKIGNTTLTIPKGKCLCHGCGGHKNKNYKSVGACFSGAGAGGFHSNTSVTVKCETCDGEGVI